MKGEVWRPIEGYEGYFEISNQGRVKSLSRKRHDINRIIPEKILSNSLAHNGYMTVMLSRDGVMKRCSVHRLIAKAFIPNPENKPNINHIDCNRANNEISNLEWCTQSENLKHMAAQPHYKNHMSGKTGKLASTSIPVHQKDIHGNILSTWDSMTDAASKLGVCLSSLSAVVKGKRKLAGGFKWERAELGAKIKERLRQSESY